MKIAISSGHGKIVRGAEGILDEVDEARLVVDEVAKRLQFAGVGVNVFHDNTSTSQSQNLDAIVNWHNKQTRDLDISVHFNAYEPTSKPMGTECLYVTQANLAAKVATAVSAASGLKNRGGKKRTDLAFLNGTDEPAILIETCFVDSEADAGIYAAKFGAICGAICEAVAGVPQSGPVPPTPPSSSDALFEAKGKASYFGGPEDSGVSSSEGLAFFTTESQAPHLFLAIQPKGTTGLARRLNPHVHYVACRWDYEKTPKEMLASGAVALVSSPATGMAMKAFPADWGPHESTNRVADLSPSLMEDLGIETDWQVEVIFPFNPDNA